MPGDLRIGSNLGSDGGMAPFRASRECGLVVTNAGARYGEAAARSTMFTCATGAAGVAPGTALGTAPPICLYNPVNSGKYLELVRGTCGYLSGTLGAGSVVYAGPAASQLADPTGGTVLTVMNNLVGGADTATIAKAFQGSTVSSTPRLLRPVFTFGAALASSVAFASTVSDDMGGEFYVAPGYFFCMQGIAAAGTSPLVLLSLTWRECSI